MPNCISLGSINVKSMYYVGVQWHNNNILTLKTFAGLIAAKVLTHLIACCSRCGKSLSPIYSSTKLTTTTVLLILHTTFTSASPVSIYPSISFAKISILYILHAFLRAG